jgi:hypothetical protein
MLSECTCRPCLTTCALASFAQCETVHLQGLISLDISHNSFACALTLAHQLNSLGELRNLAVVGNPLCLSAQYDCTLCHVLGQLALLDGKSAVQGVLPCRIDECCSAPV